MKKFISFLLLFAMLLASLAACSDDDGESSGDESEPSVSSEESKEPVILNPEYAEAVDRVLSGSVDRTTERTNILNGCTYEFSRESGDNGTYADTDMKKLTDGIRTEIFNTHEWVGFAGLQPVTLTFDLGEVREGIADVEIWCFRQLDYAIGLPGYAELLVSEDGEAYTSVSKLMKPSNMNDTQQYTFGFYLQGTIKARYIKIVLGTPEKGWVFVGEVSAYIYDGVGDPVKEYVQDYYQSGEIEKTEPVYWAETESDYNTLQNLATGKRLYITPFTPIPNAQAKESDNTPLSGAGVLTDGAYASNPAWDSPEVFKFSHGDGRYLIFDLEKISEIKEIKGEFVTHVSWGVTAPTELGVSISENGVDWQGVGTGKIPFDKSIEKQKAVFNVELDGTYAARYVKISFGMDHHCAISEIEILGTKKVTSGAKKPNPDSDPATQLNDKYFTPEMLDNISNILCTPICRSNDGKTYDETAMVTHDEFLPYVGYYENGVLKDTFIDAFLFSPCSGYTTAANERNLEGWKFYIESQFVKDRNLDALNQAVKTVGDGLGIDDYKVNIFISILRTFPTTKDGAKNVFGDVDGDGVDEVFDNINDRKKAVKWIIDTQLEMLDEAGFENLNVTGFYWHEESIQASGDEYEVELVKYAVDYVHSLGYKIIWIPYYKAEGYKNWKDYGFDMACMQPNYSFDPVYERLDAAAAIARLYGMCVEFELSSYTNRVNIARYKEYLEYAVKHGYQDGIRVYYHGTVPSDLTLAMESDDEYTSSVYRDTYLLSKGLLDETYNKNSEGEIKKGDDLDLETKYNTAVSGTVTVDTKENYEIVLTLSPKYGSLNLSADGRFEYTPSEDYTGEDYFCVAASYLYGISEDITIKINVTE